MGEQGEPEAPPKPAPEAAAASSSAEPEAAAAEAAEDPAPAPPAGPVAIFWDLHRCALGRGLGMQELARSIAECGKGYGTVANFRAYGDYRKAPPELRQGLQNMGVQLVDIPGKQADPLEKALLVDILLFAVDHRPPATVVLISGDRDFSVALNRLSQRKYKVVLIRPSKRYANSALTGAADEVLEWTDVTGEEPLDEAGGDGYAEAGEGGKAIPFFSGDAATIGQLMEQGVTLEGVLNQLLEDQESKGGHGISDIPPDVVPISSFFSYFNRTAPAARVDLQAASKAGVVELGGQRPKEWVRLCRGVTAKVSTTRNRKGPIPFFSGDASQIDYLVKNKVTLESVLCKLRDEGHGRIDLPQDAIPLSSVYTYFNRNFPLVRVDLQTAERERIAELGGKRPMEWVRLFKEDNVTTTPIGLVEEILRIAPEGQLYAEELNKELAKLGLHSSHYGFPRFKDFLMALPRDIFAIERCGQNGERLRMSLIEQPIPSVVVEKMQGILLKAPSGSMYAEDLNKELNRQGIFPASFGHQRLKDFLSALPKTKFVFERCGTNGERLKVSLKGHHKATYTASQDNIFVGSPESLQLMKDNGVTLHSILESLSVSKDKSVSIHTLYQFISRKYHVKLDLEAACRSKIVETGGHYPDKWVRPLPGAHGRGKNQYNQYDDQDELGRMPLSVQNIWRSDPLAAMHETNLPSSHDLQTAGVTDLMRNHHPFHPSEGNPREEMEANAMMNAIDQRLMDLIK